MIGLFVATPVISTLIYFGVNANKTISQSTIYLEQDGNQKITTAKDLSNLNITKIIQIGYYQEKPRDPVQVVRMPKTIQEVPDKLPEQITSLKSMFQDCTAFDQNILSWDVSNVIDMSYMFNGASSFTQDLSNWKLNPETYFYLFSIDSELEINIAKQPKFTREQNTIYLDGNNQQQETNQTNLSDINTKKIIQIGFYQQSTDVIRAVRMPKIIEEVSNQLPRQIASLGEMFSDTYKFNQPLNWDTSNVTDMSNMFTGAVNFNQPLNWDTSNVTDMNYMFKRAVYFNQDLSLWNVDKVTTHQDFALDSGFANNPEWQPKFKS